MPPMPSRPRSFARSTAAHLALTGLLALPTGAAVAQSSPCAQVRLGPAVQVTAGKATVVRPAAPVTRILLGNPQNNTRAARPAETPKDTKDTQAVAPDTRAGVADIDVLLLSPSELYVLGKSLGSTNLILLDRQGGCTAFDVVVSLDTSALQGMITQLLPDEKTVRVSSAYDSIVLSGVVSDNEALTRITDLAGAFARGQGAGSPRIVNMLTVGAPQQVMLEVKVAEVSKSLMDKLGVQAGLSKTNGNWTYNLLADFLTGGNAVGSAIRGIGNATLKIDAQKTDGLVKILAEPTIMAISGQTGSFLAGGKIFVPMTQGSGADRALSLVEKEFGVSVKFTPTVLGGGRINLVVRPEVSEISREGLGVSSGSGPGAISAVLPSLTSRKAETTVQLMDGQSFAIGGLIKNNVTTNVKAFPFLGELPVIGALFRSSEFQTDRSEMVFVITPRLVKPLPADYRLPTDDFVPPSRSDLMLGGRLEGTPTAAAAKPPKE